MGLSNSVPVNKNKTYTQEDIKNRMQKIFVNSQNQQNTTYSTLNFDSMRGGSVINDIINNNIDSSSNNYFIGGNYDDSAYEGLNMIKSGIINLNGGGDNNNTSSAESLDSSSTSDSTSDSSSDESSKSSDEKKKKDADDKKDNNNNKVDVNSNNDSDIVSTDKNQDTNTEGTIFANSKVFPFYSSDTSSEYNFQYPRSKNRFDI